jgi:hypothetical protein
MAGMDENRALEAALARIDLRRPWGLSEHIREAGISRASLALFDGA